MEVVKSVTQDEVMVEEEVMDVDVRMYCQDVSLVPNYETDGAAGFDLKAAVKSNVVIPVRDRWNWRRLFNRTAPSANWALIPTGVRTEIQKGYEIQIRPRSGLALKHGISIVNSPGTIDSDYRGDIGIILINHGNKPFVVTPGMKIAQGVLSKVERMNRVPVRTIEELSSTKRGAGGFGHTGV